MSTSAHASAPQSRPYRSHRVPACIRCRSRKIRCHIDIPGEPCLSCRERRLKCQYIESSDVHTSPDALGSSSRAKKRRRISNGDGDDEDVERETPVLHKPSSHPSASIMLAPHIAEDVEILQRHFSRHRHQQRVADTPTTTTISGNGTLGPPSGAISSSSQNQVQVPRPSTSVYKTLSHDTSSPIVYLTVPRFRTGLAPRVGAGTEQLEIISQLVGVFHREVIELYFAHVHPNFPVLDEESCSVLRKGEYERLSKSLMCVVYAIGMPFWRRSEVLKMHPRPDVHFVWNKVGGLR
jgi:hypothetical protein